MKIRLYDRLIQRKRHGEKLDMKNMTYSELYQLWWKEAYTDAQIAALYEVPKKKVINLRYKWSVKAPETIVSEFTERFPDEIPPLEEHVPGNPSPAAAFLLRKIDELNDIELESLRLELARKYTLIAQAKSEMEFLSTVEKVIRYFWTQNP